ncbi:hypothetical protein B5X24_HaOG208238 [Helicoverpa armigera]|uniref:Uncharacterized protein n=1 Tax=Helicoverpa armigera TaxID=29058 RepID=A0A2W1BMR6_HELAM|nr:hypothetical protein B5X24_HaOG208238 [Helicoverpa armigera]
MILNVFLFLFYTVLVSSNNGLNGSPVIPAQTYPFYQQNGYPNQPSDSTPYLQNTMVQNQAPSSNLSPSNIRQMLINKLLSNQPLQTNFNPNAGGYGSNLVGYPTNPIAANIGNTYYGTPLVENYQIPSTNKDVTPTEPNPEGKRKKHKRRRSKSRRKHDESNNNDDPIEKVDEKEDTDAELPQKTKKRSRKRNNDSSTQNTSTIQTENETRTHSRTKKRKSKENEEGSAPVEESKVENPTPRRRRKKKPKLEGNDVEKVTSEIIVPKNSTPSKSSKVKQEDLNIEKEGITEENRVVRNSKPETNELSKLIPNLPESFATAFNFNGMPQFQNNPAMSSFLANYENIYQSMMPKNQEPVVKKNNKVPANKSRPQQRRKSVVKSKNATITANTTKSANSSTPLEFTAVTPKINVVPKNKTIYIDGIKRPNTNPMPKNESSKSNDEPPKVEAVTDEVLKNDETIDKHEEAVIENDNTDEDGDNIDYEVPPDPDYSKGYISDYYPQFADSVVNTANNKEVYIKNLGDTKYYYAVDKGNGDIGRMRFESFTLPERVPKDYEKNKKYEEIELASVKNATKPSIKENKEEILEFRSPPLLETVDFETRKVERHNTNTDHYYNFSDNENDDLNHRYIGDKSSIYSEVKAYHTGSNDNAIKRNNEKQKKDVETVFAKSKVVKYGPGYNPNDQAKSSSNVEGITYILASPVDEPEFYW